MDSQSQGCEFDACLQLPIFLCTCIKCDFIALYVASCYFFVLKSSEFYLYQIEFQNTITSTKKTYLLLMKFLQNHHVLHDNHYGFC